MKTGTLHRLRLLSCAVLSACAGGGGAHSLNPPAITAPGSSAGAKATAPLAIRIVVPTVAPKGTRRPGYVGAGTQSVTVVVTPSGGTPGTSQLISCLAGTCSGSVGAPVGSDSVTVNLYDQPAGGGHLLSTGTTTVVVAAAASNAANLTFNPVVSTFTFATSGSLSAGTASTVGVSAVAYDPDNNTIVGPGSYVDSSGNPVTITLTGLSEVGGNTTMSLTGNRTFTGPSSASATLTYSGGSSYSATFSGTSSPTVSMVPSTPLTINGYNITEFTTPTMNSSPLVIVAGPDGNLWFTEANVHQVAKITTSGTVTEYAINVAGSPVGIAAGPDGRIWFCEQGNGKIGRINTDGTGYVEYAAAGGAKPSSIIAGPDGNLWFTDLANNSIGVMSTAGVLLHNYTAGISAGAFNPGWATATNGIIVGPDGNLWFAEAGISKIAQITTTGVVTQFTDASGSWVLAVGADGNLWNASNGTVVTVLNTSGTILHTYGYPTDTMLSTAVVTGIAVGNDGALWMNDWANQAIYRMTTTNTVTTYTAGISAGVNAIGIVLGPDGNLWFAEGLNKVGRLVY